MAAQNKTPQNLSPDLKQIYDRVMNTPAKTPATPPPPSTNPPVAQTPPATIPETKQGTIQQNPATENPTVLPQPPMETPTAQEPFLTSTPPRPPVESTGIKSFSLNNLGDNKNKNVEGAKKGISKTLIIILGIIFFVAWTFFWIVFFFKPF